MVNQKEIRKMSRRDLLEILVLQSQKIDELEEELKETKELLESKQIMISETGSIAEASLKLNKVFETAQQAADQYLENIIKIQKEQEKIRIKLDKEYDKKKSTNTKNKKKTDKKLKTKSVKESSK